MKLRLFPSFLGGIGLGLLCDIMFTPQPPEIDDRTRYFDTHVYRDGRCVILTRVKARIAKGQSGYEIQSDESQLFNADGSWLSFPPGRPYTYEAGFWKSVQK